MYVSRRGDFDRLPGEIQELIDELWQVPRFSGLRRGFRPQVDVVRRDDPDAFQVVIELPGVNPNEDVSVYCDATTLVVVGERRRTCGGRYFHMEIDYGPFQRRIPLREPIDAEAIEATYKSGLLRVVLPIAAPRARNVKIAVTRRGVS